jgi:hypothetical protein
MMNLERAVYRDETARWYKSGEEFKTPGVIASSYPEAFEALYGHSMPMPPPVRAPRGGRMTSEELKTPRQPLGGDTELFLREIAYQLAVLNERLASEKTAINVGLCASNDDIPLRIVS